MTLNVVKSGRPGSTSFLHKPKEWLALYDTGAPNKAKVQMWRLLRNGLALLVLSSTVGIQRKEVFVCHTEGWRLYIIDSGHGHIRLCFGKLCSRKMEFQ